MVCVAASAAILVSACASEPYPWKRPLSLERASEMGATNVSLVDSHEGIESTWFATDRSSIGAQYGLIGALVTATMDGMANAAPSDIAQAAADEIATVAGAEKLNQSLITEVKGAVASETYKIRFGDIVTTNKIDVPKGAPNDTIEVNVAYYLSQDATALKVEARALYMRNDVKYATPYTFKSIPQDELDGPLYRNSFIYESNRLALPTPTPEMKKARVEEVKKRIAAQYGALPTKKGDKGFPALQDALQEANNDTFTDAEASSALTKIWASNNGKLILDELQAAHAYIAKYLLIDLNSTAVPKLDGQDEIVETLADGRVVRLMGAGAGAGWGVAVFSEAVLPKHAERVVAKSAAAR